MYFTAFCSLWQWRLTNFILKKAYTDRSLIVNITDAASKRGQIIFDILIKVLTLYKQGKMNAPLTRFEQNLSIFEHILTQLPLKWVQNVSSMKRVLMLNICLFGRTEYFVPYRPGSSRHFENYKSLSYDETYKYFPQFFVVLYFLSLFFSLSMNHMFKWDYVFKTLSFLWIYTPVQPSLTA